MKSQLNNAHEVLTDNIRKIEEARLAGYAAIVAESQSKAQRNLIRAEKALKAAQNVVEKQAAALEAFAQDGDSDHLELFGIND